MADLEQELRTLGTMLDVPDPPDVRGTVRARIEAPTSRPYSVRLRWAAAVMAAALTAALVASPQARAAIAEVFRFAGIEVHWGAEDPTVPSRAPLPGQDATSLAAAREAANFSIGVPARLGGPDRVMVADSARVVSLLYGSGAALLRLDEFDGRLDPVFVKTVSQQAEHVDVDSTLGLWLSGPHTVRYVDRDGVVRRETARLAGNTLIWESGGVTYRLEGDLTRVEAVAIAESIR